MQGVTSGRTSCLVSRENIPISWFCIRNVRTEMRQDVDISDTALNATCIPDSVPLPHRITSAKCRVNTVVSPDDGHIVGRNM